MEENKEFVENVKEGQGKSLRGEALEKKKDIKKVLETKPINIRILREL